MNNGQLCVQQCRFWIRTSWHLFEKTPYSNIQNTPYTISPTSPTMHIRSLDMHICIRTKFSVRNLYVIRMTLIEGSRVRSRLLGLVHMMHDNIVFVDSKDCRVGDLATDRGINKSTIDAVSQIIGRRGYLVFSIPHTHPKSPHMHYWK